jgi:hypothetical protein
MTNSSQEVRIESIYVDASGRELWREHTYPFRPSMRQEAGPKAREDCLMLGYERTAQGLRFTLMDLGLPSRHGER